MTTFLESVDEIIEIELMITSQMQSILSILRSLKL